MALDNAGDRQPLVDDTTGMALENGAGVDNQPGGSFTLRGAAARSSSDGTGTYFTNQGTLTERGAGRRTSGRSSSRLSAQTGTGSTLVQAGELESERWRHDQRPDDWKRGDAFVFRRRIVQPTSMRRQASVRAGNVRVRVTGRRPPRPGSTTCPGARWCWIRRPSPSTAMRRSPDLGSDC